MFIFSLSGVCVCVVRLTVGSVVDRGGAAGHQRGDGGRGQSCSHVQQRLDEVTLEHCILLPQVEDPNYLTL